MSLSSEACDTSSACGALSSQEVSPSVLQSGISPVLARYKQYLQSCYNARVLAPADKYLPTLESPYINLAMIRRGCYNHEQRDEFTRRTLHGGVDQILEKKTPINIEDLLTPEDSGKPVRFILIEGPPGIGKSTFAWEVCRRWDEIESLRDYHTVVLLKLREKWVLNATSFVQLFRCPFQPELSPCVAQLLHFNSFGLGLLLVLDGFDEVSHSFHENSVIKSILCRQLLPKCTIILTTRPVAKYTLRSICQPRVDKHVEIIGFTEEERVRYITEVFSKEPELQVNFLKYMFLVPHIKSMMYIPLNCAIIAQVYYESQSSHHLAIPRTRTQLYKALTHSILVRHMKTNDSNCEYTSMFPEGLDEENVDRFNTLAKFAFDTYHKGESTKVTFFKEDIPEGLVHFGFMNESTEMYAGKGVERTFSFLHLSLQEYLAAWHLADSYSIEFQVAYHRLAVDPFIVYRGEVKIYKGTNKEEEALISSLQQQSSSLVEPAIFLAGITGWRCQSEDDRNHWEMYLGHDTVRIGNVSVLLQSLYEAQNPTVFPNYFTDSRRKFLIGSETKKIPVVTPVNEDLGPVDPNPHTPYDCYALSYCLANSSDQLCFSLSFGFNNDNDIPLVETFVKGLNDHCLTTTPRVKHLEIEGSSPSLVDRGLLWLMRANFLAKVEESVLDITIINNSGAQTFLPSLVNLQSLEIHDPHYTLTPAPIKSWKWLAGLKFLSELKVLHISSRKECSLPPTDLLHWLIEGVNKLKEFVLDIEFPSNTIYDLHNPTDVLVDSVVKSVLRSNQIIKIVLSNISRETMAGVHNILLHCPSLTTLELKRTRLGYDGILYIYSALRNNTTLRCLVIHDLQLSQSLDEALFRDDIISPGQTTCTDLLLELSNIVKDNTLEEMNIQTGRLSTSEKMILLKLKLCNISSDVAHHVLQTLAKFHLITNVRYFKWLASSESLKHLQELCVSNNPEAEHPLHVNLNTVALSNISRETMAGVHHVLLIHCPNLTTLELERTRLGYDGILYICSALRNNTTLKCLKIYDDLRLPQFSDEALSSDAVILPGKTTCTDLLLELSNIVKDNTLRRMNIQTELHSTSEQIIFGLKLCYISSDVAHDVLQTLAKIQFLKNVKYCKWLASRESLKHLQELCITNKPNFYSDVNVLDIEFPTSSDICNALHQTVDLIVHKLVIRLNTFSKVVLSNISRETTAGVHNILLHCPSLTTLELKRTRLGYDGILYICSALRYNTTLKCLKIYDDLQLPQFSDEALSSDAVILPGKTTCTDLLLELSNTVKDNTLRRMNIQTELHSTSEQIIFGLKLCYISSDVAHDVLQTLAKIQFLKNVKYCEWLASLQSLKHLQELCITNNDSTLHSDVNVLDIEFPTSSDVCNALHQTVDLIVHKLVIRLNSFSKVVLSNISHETMAGVHNILLHCPSLTTLELKRTRLGYDGILYLCSALRNNKILTHILIHDDLQLPPSRKSRKWGDIQFTSFSSMERVPLPGKTTCTDFLLELNNILKDNTTLKRIKIQSGLFLPLSAGKDGEYCQWTGLGPLQQFNVGAVGSGMSPNLRRSFSSSDLTQPQTTLFWDRHLSKSVYFIFKGEMLEVDFKKLYSKRKEEGKKLFSLPSFTAPDTEVLQSFSGLDPRLKECLEISHLHQYVKRLRGTYWEMTRELAEYLQPNRH